MSEMAVDVQSPFSRSLVYATYRDQLIELGTTLPKQNRFLEHGDRTLIESRGALKVDLSGLQGVPAFLRDSTVSWVEGLLAKKIEPNLVQMGQNVQEYLEQMQQTQSPPTPG